MTDDTVPELNHFPQCDSSRLLPCWVWGAPRATSPEGPVVMQPRLPASGAFLRAALGILCRSHAMTSLGPCGEMHSFLMHLCLLLALTPACSQPQLTGWALRQYLVTQQVSIICWHRFLEEYCQKKREKFLHYGGDLEGSQEHDLAP